MCKEQEALSCVAVHYWMPSFSRVRPWGRSSLCALLLWPNERSTHLWSAFAFKTLTGTAHLFVYGNGKTITESHGFILVHLCVFSFIRVKLSRMLLHDPPTSPVVDANILPSMHSTLHPPIGPAWKQNKTTYERKWEGTIGLKRQADK